MGRTELFFAAVVMALLLAPARAEEIRVTTRNGATFLGRTSKKRLDVKTEWGSATIDFEHIRSIDFGDPDVVAIHDGVELRGEVRLSSLPIRTAQGTRRFKRSELARLVAVDDGSPGRRISFGGIWQTTYGPMKLEQEGLAVKGTYGVGDPFTIEGRIRGTKLEFKTRSRGEEGQGWFELWPGGQGFKGEVQRPGGASSVWAGYRAEPRLPRLQPGEIRSGIARSGVKVHVRAPRDVAEKESWPALVILHGSNMNSRVYVEGTASNWPRLGREFLIIGIDGEFAAPGTTPEFERYNYSYINYSGPDWGSPAIRRQSPALVAEALEELKKALPISKLFIGGHSQGGFLSYFFVMYFPELVDGVFPMAGNLVVQCEPDVFEDQRKRRAQRQIPVAVVHGRADSVVNFSSGTYCYERLVDGGFPTVRLFDPPVGHAYAALPVDEVIHWLETMTSSDAEKLVAHAERAWGEKRYRDSLAALQRAEEARPRDRSKKRLAALLEQIDGRAAPQARALSRRIQNEKDPGWVDEFLVFREAFAFAPSAAEVMKAYARLREAHARPAADLFYAARGAQDPAEKRAKWREIVEKYYASKWYPLCKRWLEE